MPASGAARLEVEHEPENIAKVGNAGAAGLLGIDALVFDAAAALVDDVVEAYLSVADDDLQLGLLDAPVRRNCQMAYDRGP